jgi:hypothetical protein
MTKDQEREILNRALETIKWISPLANLSNLGEVEPPAAYLRDGMLAFADGINWNPGWGGGLYRYSVSEAHWLPVGPESVKSYHMRSESGSSGIYYAAGYYDAPAADANLTQAGLTIVNGDANVPYAAHTFTVFGAASGSGGSGTDRKIKLTVTGTRIEDNGTRTPNYTETVTDDAEGLTLNDYLEQDKFIGQVTFTLSATGVDPYTTFSMDFNYGFCKYDDLGNNDFNIIGLECVGLAGANDNNFNIELLHHEATGWTYHATAFVPGAVVLADMRLTHGAESDIDSGEYFTFKSTDVHHTVFGAAAEGYLIRVTTSANNAVEYIDMHVAYH